MTCQHLRSYGVSSLETSHETASERHTRRFRSALGWDTGEDYSSASETRALAAGTSSAIVDRSRSVAQRDALFGIGGKSSSPAEVRLNMARLGARQVAAAAPLSALHAHNCLPSRAIIFHPKRTCRAFDLDSQ